MAPELQRQARRFREWAIRLLRSVAAATAADRFGEFGVVRMASTLAARALREFREWGACRYTAAYYFEALACAARECFWSACRSERVECVQVAALRRLFEPSLRGRNYFRPQLLVALDRLLFDGFDEWDLPTVRMR